MPELSVLIPSRNEEFLARTVQDILQHSDPALTEVIVVLDGPSPHAPVPVDPRVQVVALENPIGQRAACNLAARSARGTYLAKCDAHCAFAPGFDRVLLEDMRGHDNWAMVPTMRNLWVFDWRCPNGHRRYQSPSGPCTVCGQPTVKDMVWTAKANPQSTSYCFDATPHFQYFRAFKSRPEGKGPITETMSLQGSFWMVPAALYWDLELCDESWGSWGSQGIEVACKVWLSGGRVVCNQRTWYAHAFRTMGGDWGFPYPMSAKQAQYAQSQARELFFANRWPKQVHPLSWLVERFWPVPGWKAEDLAALKPAPKRAILYYTDGRLAPDIMRACQAQLKKAGLPIICVSLVPTDFGDIRIHMQAERGVLTLFRQIVAGLEATDADVIYMAEHDNLLHPSHFEFTPPREDTFYYNTNVWRVRYPDGHAVWTDDLQQVSGMCAYRELILRFYKERIAKIERDGFDRHYEPSWKTGDWKTENWTSPVPNLDIRHPQTMTRSKWSPAEYRNQRYAKGWKEGAEVPGWGRTEGRLMELLTTRLT